MKKTFVADDMTAPLPAKKFLRQYLGVSARLIKRIKYHGDFKVNGTASKLALTMICPGDEISYELVETPSFAPEAMPLEICYEDEDLLIVNKPARLLVHPVGKEQQGTLASGVLHYLREKGETCAFHPVHRLDRGTSGLILIAKDPRIQHLLSADGQGWSSVRRADFAPAKKGKLFERHYIAFTEHPLTPKSGVIDLPIGRAPGSIVKHSVTKEGKRAVTHYETINSHATPKNGLVRAQERDATFLRPPTALRLTLETGRTHQIRVHLSHMGAPLLGDDLYGGNTSFISRPALHAERIRFLHPATGKLIEVTAPLPDDLAQLYAMSQKP